MALNKAERLYQHTAEAWPRKLLVTQVQYDAIKANAVKDGVSPHFFAEWSEKYLTLLEELLEEVNSAAIPAPTDGP